MRDVGLLESAAHRPTTALWGADACPTLFLKAAALLDSVVNHHGLVDGNKRLGWLATVVFVDLNGVLVEAPDDAASDLVLTGASRGAILSRISDALEAWGQP